MHIVYSPVPESSIDFKNVFKKLDTVMHLKIVPDTRTIYSCLTYIYNLQCPYFFRANV